jgi:spermidine/putrescine transport system substrate-binding protein
MLSRRSAWITGVILLVGAAALWLSRPLWISTEPKEINVLLWAGYEEPEILTPFTTKHGIKVNFKTFFGGDAMYSLFMQSKGLYDAVIVDPEYIQKLQAAGRLKELDPKEFDTTEYLAPFRQFPLSSIDGKLYAPVVEFGANAIVYNTKHITEQEAKSYSILFDPKVKGRVGVWDWYLPIMGVMSRSMGHTTPYDLSQQQFDALKMKMTELRPQLRAIHGNIPEVLAALAADETWVVPGGAGWAAAALQQQGKPYDWTVPAEGGIMWVDTIVIPNDAPHPELAKLFVKYMMSAQAQAALSKKKAYFSNVPNAASYALMTDEHKKGLKSSTEQELLEWVSRLSVRSLPARQSEKAWQEVWETFKAKQ